MGLSSMKLHQLLYGYEWMMRNSKQSVNVDVDLSHIDKFLHIIVVRVNGKWIAIPADTYTKEQDILEEVKKYEK